MSDNRINDQIDAPEVIVIDPEGNNIGKMKITDAYSKAEEYELDLVEMSKSPSVCRLMDYGKYIYENKKKKQANKKKDGRKGEVKTIRLRPNIQDHDLDIKAEQARKFLLAGQKVRIDVRLKGRERSRPQLIGEVAARFAAILDDVSVVSATGNDIMLVSKDGK